MSYEIETLDGETDDGTMPENVSALASVVTGRKIVSVEKDAQILEGTGSYISTGTALTLDNGKRVFLADTSDCCAYTKLETFLLHHDRIDHVITGVGTTGKYTRWHIYADMGDVLELTVGWSSGNPFYYGYGFDICVTEPA